MAACKQIIPSCTPVVALHPQLNPQVYRALLPDFNTLVLCISLSYLSHCSDKIPDVNT